MKFQLPTITRQQIGLGIVTVGAGAGVAFGVTEGPLTGAAVVAATGLGGYVVAREEQVEGIQTTNNSLNNTLTQIQTDLAATKASLSQLQAVNPSWVLNNKVLPAQHRAQASYGQFLGDLATLNSEKGDFVTLVNNQRDQIQAALDSGNETTETFIASVRGDLVAIEQGTFNYPASTQPIEADPEHEVECVEA